MTTLRTSHFCFPKGGWWRLSPAYDVTHAHAPDSQWTGQHLMAVNGRTTRITRADVRQVGDRFSVPSASDIIEQVLDAVATCQPARAKPECPRRPPTTFPATSRSGPHRCANSTDA